jgi:hypothetical protein
MAAYIARDRDHGRAAHTVREFVSEFRGLSGTGSDFKAQVEVEFDKMIKMSMGTPLRLALPV